MNRWIFFRSESCGNNLSGVSVPCVGGDSVDMVWQVHCEVCSNPPSLWLND